MLKLLGPGLGTGFGAGRRLVAQACRTTRRRGRSRSSFIAPDDSIPWNYWMNFIVLDKQGKNRGMWTPGVENDPEGDKRHRPFPGATFKVRVRPRGARVDPGPQAAARC